ncbi:hypothetical protein SSP531S_50730 [Streptomyces spongiicola]|uniref:Uncharacterized protein n=1 Tax=Streptomyces spongiicola TaxID=1690221 RepID=A0A388T3S8_9ACTN|nr:hypothetical protein SSP531S_50730 [Streptomyces spongiicola]
MASRTGRPAPGPGTPGTGGPAARTARRIDSPVPTMSPVPARQVGAGPGTDLAARAPPRWFRSRAATRSRVAVRGRTAAPRAAPSPEGSPEGGREVPLRNRTATA